MRRNHVLGKKVQIATLCGHIGHRTAEKRAGRAEDERVTGRGKGTIEASPSQKKRGIERRQNPGIKRKWPGKNDRGQNTKRRHKPERHE
ncbi:hypothetical protein pdam_00020790 [Pocillopora damicornis]|uniref:Uncharacterized protein n=1 Tax=Pocillopora damicornis TaxID=46731 RepID=A0A3M6UMY8_POCDA|nr:hypothetical protein pdam_00020790 [Pocillopora damicornis]